MTTTSTVSGKNTMSADVLAAVNPKTTTLSETDITQNRFLKLLTTQLKNQDPLNPLDNAQMTSQMAQISTVNGIEKLNITLEKMMSTSSDAQAIQAAAMLGHQVLVAGTGMTVGENGQAFGGIELPQTVDNATITIKDANGLTVRTLNLGVLPAGLQDFGWDGKNDAGSPVAAGRYSFSVTAEQGGKAVSATTLELAPVTGILRDKSGVRVELGQLGNFALSDIRQIY
jgi:flagellar basal-body rod modification protein FlgD